MSGHLIRSPGYLVTGDQKDRTAGQLVTGDRRTESI